MLSSLLFQAKQSSFSEFFSILQEIWSQAAKVFKNPRSSPKEAALLLSILVVFTLIVAFSALLFYFLTEEKVREEKEEKEEKEEEKSYQKREVRLTTLAVLFLLLVLIFSLSSSPLFCSSCHNIKPYYLSWKASNHSKVSCLSCHQKPGLAGWVETRLEGLENLRLYIYKQKKTYQKRVSDSACLDCHQEIKTRVVGEKIKMSHQEVITGKHCFECHPNRGHEEKKPVALMEHCLPCHLEKDKKLNCLSCHRVDIAYNPHANLLNYRLAHLVRRPNCKYCHQTATLRKCNYCHQTEMPHPQGWRDGGHAREAFINKKNCYRCHPKPGFCASCHLGLGGKGQWPHGQQFIRTHKTGQRELCFRCHGRGLCDLCHPKGKYR